MKRVRLSKDIKTVDDLLTNEGVEWVINQLIKEKAELADIIAIKIKHDGVRQIITTLQNMDNVLAELQRAIYWQIDNERRGLEPEDDDEGDDE